MSASIDLQDLIREVEEVRRGGTALERVHEAVTLSEELGRVADALVDHFIQEARTSGLSWADIGQALGVSKQAAQQRHVSARMRRLGRRGMFKRFTDGARRVVTQAQTISRQWRHDYIGPEHLLAAIAREADSLAIQALGRAGVEATLIEGRIREVSPPGTEAPEGHIPFTPRAKKCLELSLRQALSLNHDFIGTEHMLLGVIAEGGAAAAVVASFGADLDRVKSEVIALHRGTEGTSEGGLSR